MQYEILRPKLENRDIQVNKKLSRRIRNKTTHKQQMERVQLVR